MAATSPASHGGLAGRRVAFILSRALREDYAARMRAGDLRNHDIFDFANNAIA
jgi:hypothetical protein